MLPLFESHYLNKPIRFRDTASPPRLRLHYEQRDNRARLSFSILFRPQIDARFPLAATIANARVMIMRPRIAVRALKARESHVRGTAMAEVDWKRGMRRTNCTYDRVYSNNYAQLHNIRRPPRDSSIFIFFSFERNFITRFTLMQGYCMCVTRDL